MKYLFVVLGEGRGHLTQALSMYEMLTRNGDEVTEMLVGKSEKMSLPNFFTEKVQCPVTTFKSPTFIFSQKNKKSLLTKTILFNLKKTFDYIRSIRLIKRRIKANNVDLVINFYELLTGLTYAFNRMKTPYVCVAHQYLLLHPDFEFPKKKKMQLIGLLLFTRLTCFRASKLLALSFREMKNTGRIRVVPPLLRKEVLSKTPTNGNFILGYMLHAGFSEQVIDWHKHHKETSLYFFWDKKEVAKELQVDETLTFHQLDDEVFLNRMASCKAYASTGGFESICEAMYLKKPVMMIPAHIEQECNALDAMNAGAGIASDEFDLTKLLEFLPCYQPNTDFISWINQSNSLFLGELRFEKNVRA
jgi:uncharacterized protein (TIGR00661 family)